MLLLHFIEVNPDINRNRKKLAEDRGQLKPAVIY